MMSRRVAAQAFLDAPGETSSAVLSDYSSVGRRTPYTEDPSFPLGPEGVSSFMQNVSAEVPRSPDMSHPRGNMRMSPAGSATTGAASASGSGSRQSFFRRMRRTSISFKNMLPQYRSPRDGGGSDGRRRSIATDRHNGESSSMASDIANKCKAVLRLNHPRYEYTGPLFDPIETHLASTRNTRPELYGKPRNDSNITLSRSSDEHLESGNYAQEALSQTARLRRNSHMHRKDPMACLPLELASIIFSYLDVKSLAKASQVSTAWSRAASDQHVWKSVFLNRFEPKPRSCPLPVAVGGLGVGKSRAFEQDWQGMYCARANLEMNWSKGNAMGIYLNGHTDSVYCVQYNEDYIITGSRDRTFRVWDIETFECIKVVGIPSARETDRRELATHLPHPPLLPEDHITHPNPARELDDSVYHVPSYYHDASILCLQFDDEIMVTGSSDCTLIVWNVKTWEPIHHLRAHSAGVLDIAFDKEKIISCSKDATLCVWDRATGKLLQRITGHMGPVNAVQLRGQLVISASGEGCARLWNLGYQPRRRRRSSVGGGYEEESAATCDPKCVKEFWSKDRGLACVEFSDDARFVLAGGNDQVIYKFDTQNWSTR